MQKGLWKTAPFRLSKNSVYRKLIKIIGIIKRFLKTDKKEEWQGFCSENLAIACFLRNCLLQYPRTATKTISQNIPSFCRSLSACRLCRHAERSCGNSSFSNYFLIGLWHYPQLLFLAYILYAMAFRNKIASFTVPR